MRRGPLTSAAIRVAIILGALAIADEVVAALPRVLSTSGATPSALFADVTAPFAIFVVWIALTARAARSADTLWALPSDLFRATIAFGATAVVAARVEWLALARPEGVATRTLVATTIEDVLYGLGIVALAALAAFALARTLLRPALRELPAPLTARDVTLRTRFFVASTGAAFSTAGVLLDVLVDFERTSDAALAGYLFTAAALVVFAAIIGLLVGDDTARGIESVSQRMRELAMQESDLGTVPRLAADEIGVLAAAATALERRLRRDEARTAASAERERIARELHDGVAKSVSVLALEAATIAVKSPEPLRPDLARIEHLARLLSEELRAIVTDVRSRDADEPFAALLRRTVARHPGAHIELEGQLDRVGTLARFELLRVLEEALRNAVRHAEASEIVARVGVRDGHVRLEVEDNGRGIPEVRWDDLGRAGRYGLIGMRERAELLRGTIAVSRGTHGGTQVCVTVPLTPQ